MSRYRIQDKHELKRAGRKMTRFKLWREVPPMRGMSLAGTYELDGWNLTDAEILRAAGLAPADAEEVNHA